MNTNINFGECLKIILNTLDISMSRLSKHINVDSSLVCRWVNGKRVPQYSTNYIEHIADFLSKNINNTFQEQEINKLYKTILGTNPPIDNFSLAFMILLKETQGFTLKIHKAEKEQLLASKRALVQDINIEKHAISENTAVDTIVNLPPSIEGFQSIGLSGEDRIVFGFDSILTSIHSLIESVATNEYTHIKDRKIYFTFNFLCFEYCSNEWIDTIKQGFLYAIQNGWEIILLLKINVDLNGLISFLHFVIPYLKTGMISVYYFNSYETKSNDREVYVIPNVGAISTLSTDPKSMNNHGFFLRSQAAIQIFTNYITSVITTQTSNLITYYSIDKLSLFISNYNKALANNGNIYNYNNNYNLFLMNETIYKRLLMKSDLTSNEQQKSIAYHRSLHRSIQKHLLHNEYYEVYFADSLETLKQNMTFKLFTPYGEKVIAITTEDYIEYVESLIDAINSNDSYCLAIIYNRKKSLVSGIEFSMKARHSLYVDKVDGNNTCFSIDEAMTLKAMEEFFIHNWNHIAPINKDKTDITKWLQGYIHKLKNK